jgi:hypothetical protein
LEARFDLGSDARGGFDGGFDLERGSSDDSERPCPQAVHEATPSVLNVSHWPQAIPTSISNRLPRADAQRRFGQLLEEPGECRQFAAGAPVW